MPRRTYSWLPVAALLLAFGCGKPISNTLRVESGRDQPFTHDECTLFVEAIEGVATRYELKREILTIQKDPRGAESFLWAGYGDEDLTIDAECSPGRLRAVVRNRSVDPFGKIRSRSHARASSQLAEVLRERFAGPSRTVSVN